MDPLTLGGAVVSDAVDVVALTRALVDIDSTTGREGEAGRWLADYLRARGRSAPARGRSGASRSRRR